MGTNYNGELGLDINNYTVINPALINPSYFQFEKVIQLKCGGIHTLALTGNPSK
jgi:hypothetical protein